MLDHLLAEHMGMAIKILSEKFIGDGLLDQIKVLFSDGSDKAIRQQVKQFLDARPAQPRILNINAWNEWLPCF